MKTRSTVTAKGTENEKSAEKLDLYNIHGKLGILIYEFRKAMSPLRAIAALEDGLMNPESTKESAAAKEDALNLASVALIALTKTNEDLLSLANRIEEQDMAQKARS